MELPVRGATREAVREWLFSELIIAYREARKHKLHTEDEQKFEMHAAVNLVQLTDDILNRRYHPSRGIAFITHRPVIREIFAAPFRDRVIHHFLFNASAEWWDRRFSPDSYSCRKGKGTLYGIERLQHHIQAMSENYKYVNDMMVAKLDIQGYFMSLPRKKLYQRVKWGLDRQFPEDVEGKKIIEFLWKEVIFDDPTKGVTRRDSIKAWDDLPDSKSLFCQPPGQGVVIGNLSSQLLSNIYLDMLDRFVTQELGYERYGRYVDDFYIIVRKKDYQQLLRDIEAIREFLKNVLGLTLHPKKLYIQPVMHGVPFLGVVVRPGWTLPGERIKKNFRKAVRRYMMGYGEDATITSYMGHMDHMNSKKFIERVFREVGWR